MRRRRVVSVVPEADRPEVSLSWMGELDLARHAQLLPEIELLPQSCDVDLDLGLVTFIDPCGLSLLVALDARVRDGGGTLRLCDVPPGVERLVSLAGLTHLLAAEEPLSVPRQAGSVVDAP